MTLPHCGQCQPVSERSIAVRQMGQVRKGFHLLMRHKCAPPSLCGNSGKALSVMFRKTGVPVESGHNLNDAANRP